MDAKLPLDGMFERAEGLLAAQTGDELLMMSVEQGLYYNLNPVGARIWALLENPVSIQSMITELIAEYDVSPEQVRQELEAFVSLLHKRGLVRVCDAASG